MSQPDFKVKIKSDRSTSGENEDVFERDGEVFGYD